MGWSSGVIFLAHFIYVCNATTSRSSVSVMRNPNTFMVCHISYRSLTITVIPSELEPVQSNLH